MKKPTVRAMAAFVLGASLLLSGCGATTDEADAPLAAVTWSGDEVSPVITFTAPLTVPAAVSRVVVEGTGEVPADGHVWLRTITFNGATGAEASNAWDFPQQLDLTPMTADHPLRAALMGKKVGTRALYASPFTQEDGTSLTMLTAFEIVDTPPPLTLEEGMPTASFDDYGVPTIDLTPGFSGPEDLVTEVLTKGDGAVVESGQTVTVNYSGWRQSTGTAFGSSWTDGAPLEIAPIGAGKVIAGWDQAIVGQQVGSKLLIAVPKALAYGDKPEHMLANEDLIFVIEIVAAT